MVGMANFTELERVWIIEYGHWVFDAGRYVGHREEVGWIGWLCDYSDTSKATNLQLRTLHNHNNPPLRPSLRLSHYRSSEVSLTCAAGSAPFSISRYNFHTLPHAPHHRNRYSSPLVSLYTAATTITTTKSLHPSSSQPSSDLGILHHQSQPGSDAALRPRTRRSRLRLHSSFQPHHISV